MSSSDQRAVFDAQVDDWIKEFKRVGVTRQLLYEECKRSHPDGYGSTQFYLYLSQEIGRRDLTLALSHQPGGKLQLYFAGKPFAWVDRHASYAVPVRQVSVLPPASFSLHLAMYTLPLGYVLPLNRRTRGLHPVDVRHAWRTTEKAPLAVASEAFINWR